MKRLVRIAFRRAGKIYDFLAGELELQAGDQVIVETDRGKSMGRVVHPPDEVEEDSLPEGVKSVLRPATEEDLAMAERHAGQEDDAYRYCLERIQQRQMEMKLVRAEYLFDGSKIVFYFTADGRVDFRDLVRDLAHHFRTRIEMRQIGVRDEAKQVGGLGVCGRELCCSSFLRGFAPISVKMAKEQGLALNPTKISGQCGRLLCCLEYEYETYCGLRKGLPKVGKKIPYQGETVEVVAIDIIGQKLTIRQPDGSRSELTVEQLKGDQESPCCGKAEGGHPCHSKQGGETRGERPQRQRGRDKGKRPSSKEGGDGKSSRDKKEGGERSQRQRSRRRSDGDRQRSERPSKDDNTKQTQQRDEGTSKESGEKPRRRSRPRRRPRKKPNNDSNQ